MMSGIRGRDTKPEVRVRHYLHRRGIRYRLHVRGLPGRPDIVLPGRRTVILVNGCYWHRHPGCRFAYTPKSNTAFWNEKFRKNVERDSRNLDLLVVAGWRVLTVWECEITDCRLEELVNALGDRAEAKVD